MLTQMNTPCMPRCTPRLFCNERHDRHPEAVEDCRRAEHDQHTQALRVVVLSIE